MRSALVIPLLILSGCAGSGLHTAHIGKNTTGTVAIDESKRQEVVMTALGLINTQYKYGGASPATGFDCSGLVAYVFAKAARAKLPRRSIDIAAGSRPISRQMLNAGDLVFFNTLNQPGSHVGIYLGDGQFINTPSSGGRVRIDSLDNRYFAQRFEGGGTYFKRP